MPVTCPKCRLSNPETSRFCADCGTSLPTSREIHPEVTEICKTSARELTTGSTFAGRYQIIEELGKGGMGRVYKVFDTEIKEKIALKLLKPEIGIDQAMIERFRNELKLARRIGQRHVCRMFDLRKEEDAYYITMEFVSGQDLRGLIRQSGQLAIRTTLSIAKQVSEGLAEAHRLGVVHRDLKPGNIMIDEAGNAKIMDFGIARSISVKGVTSAGDVIGTPEYMSPEQVEGKEVDQRSDIYSLGIIIYEMLTGQVPFEGDTPLAIGMKQKSEIPKDPSSLNAQIPQDLSRLVLKCLAKDRDERFQSAADLGMEIGRIQQGLPTTDRVIRKKKALTSKEITVKFRLTKALVPISAFIVLVLAAFVLWRVILPRKTAPSPSGSGQPTLVVLYFENKSGDPKLDNWRDGLTELLIEALSQSRYIRVVSSDQLYTILKRLGLADARKYSSEDIEKIAAQTWATHVLRGSYIKAGDSFVITAGLQKPGTSENPTALRLEARDEKEIISKIDELTRRVKEGLNLTATQIAGDIEKEAGKITTSSPEALKYYIEGRRLILKVEPEQGIAYMEKAVEIDPEFAMAYRSMGTAHRYLGHEAEMRKNLKKALDLSDRLPENERLLIEALWLALGEEDYAKAIDVLERLLKIYPGHTMGHSWMGGSYFLAGNLDKAIEHEEFCVQNLISADAVSDLAPAYMAKGLYQKAEDVCRSFLKDVEDNAQIHVTLGCSYLCRRQFDLAAAEAEKAYLLDPQYKTLKGWILLLKDDFAGAEKILGADWQGLLLLAQGKIQENVALAQRNLEKSKGDKEKERDAYGGLVGALERAGRYKDAYRVFEQYLKVSAEYRKSTGESGLPYLPSRQKEDLWSKGDLQAEMKSFDEAKKTAEELRFLVEKGINTKELRWYENILGLIEFGKENFRQAADLFSRACGRLNFENFADGDTFEHAMLFDALARALYGSGELDKARQEYEKITLLTSGRLFHPDIYARAYYMLGKIAEQQGDKARAHENFRKFLDLWKDADPGLPEVEDVRRRLARLK